MTAPFPEKNVEQLKAFCQVLVAQPAILWDPSLSFFRDALTKVGCQLPKQPEKKPEQQPEEAPKTSCCPCDKEADEPVEYPPFPKDAEKDEECMEGDDLSEYKEVTATEAGSDEDQEKAMELRGDGMGLMREGSFKEAIDKLTEALTLNPTKAPIWASRAECYLKWKKLNSSIKDGDKALALNPNQAKALRIRGQAKRKLGLWTEAAEDLHAANAIDFDPDMADMLKVVEGKAKKVAEYRTACKNLDEEAKRKKLLQKQEKYRKMREEEEKAEKEASAMPDMSGMGGMPGGMGGMPGGMGGGMPGMPDMSDPEIMQMLQDPDVQAGKPEAILKYANNPKVAQFMQSFMGSMGGKGGMPGMGGMGGMGGMPGMGGMGGMPGMGGMGGMPGMGKGKGGMGGMPGMGRGGASDSVPKSAPKPTSADDLD